MSAGDGKRGITPIIHVVNIAALLIGGVILLLSAVVRPYQLIGLVPLLGLLAVYWRLRRNPGAVAGFFGLAMGLFGWVLVCENIVAVDNFIGSDISRQLVLGSRLQTYVLRTHHSTDQKDVVACCGDPLMWRYRPGSRHREAFDCPTCDRPYEVVVDETGYLNGPRGLTERSARIDLFVAGDSVLQGLGVPSVVELLRPQIPMSMWNLSIQGYGPRQKVKALLTFALPKRPRWLILEFYSGNDLPDAIRDDVCAGEGGRGCRFNEIEVERRLSRHPRYRTIFDVPTGIWARFADLSAENLTLATTRFTTDAVKGAIKRRFVAPGDHRPIREAWLQNFAGSWPPARVRDGQWSAYLSAGMTLIQQEYERLGATLERMDSRPRVVLLYNPSVAELYRGSWIDPKREVGAGSSQQADPISSFQREALRKFAATHGWQFLDLTEPLRHEVQKRQIWLYGRYDQSHLSPQGTAIVADVLAAELSRMVAPLRAPLAKRPEGR